MNANGRSFEFYKVNNNQIMLAEIRPIKCLYSSRKGPTVKTTKWMELENWQELENMIEEILSDYKEKEQNFHLKGESRVEHGIFYSKTGVTISIGYVYQQYNKSYSYFLTPLDDFYDSEAENESKLLQDKGGHFKQIDYCTDSLIISVSPLIKDHAVSKLKLTEHSSSPYRMKNKLKQVLKLPKLKEHKNSKSSYFEILQSDNLPKPQQNQADVKTKKAKAAKVKHNSAIHEEKLTKSKSCFDTDTSTISTNSSLGSQDFDHTDSKPNQYNPRKNVHDKVKKKEVNHTLTSKETSRILRRKKAVSYEECVEYPVEYDYLSCSDVPQPSNKIKKEIEENNSFENKGKCCDNELFSDFELPDLEASPTNSIERMKRIFGCDSPTNSIERMKRIFGNDTPEHKSENLEVSNKFEGFVENKFEGFDVKCNVKSEYFTSPSASKSIEKASQNCNISQNSKFEKKSCSKKLATYENSYKSPESQINSIDIDEGKRVSKSFKVRVNNLIKNENKATSSSKASIKFERDKHSNLKSSNKINFENMPHKSSIFNDSKKNATISADKYDISLGNISNILSNQKDLDDFKPDLTMKLHKTSKKVNLKEINSSSKNDGKFPKDKNEVVPTRKFSKRKKVKNSSCSPDLFNKSDSTSFDDESPVVSSTSRTGNSAKYSVVKRSRMINKFHISSQPSKSVNESSVNCKKKKLEENLNTSKISYESDEEMNFVKKSCRKGCNKLNNSENDSIPSTFDDWNGTLPNLELTQIESPALPQTSLHCNQTVLEYLNLQENVVATQSVINNPNFIENVSGYFQNLKPRDLMKKYRENLDYLWKIARKEIDTNRNMKFQSGPNVRKEDPSMFLCLYSTEVYSKLGDEIIKEFGEYIGKKSLGDGSTFAYYVVIPELLKKLLWDIPFVQEHGGITDQECEDAFHDLMMNADDPPDEYAFSF